MIEYELILSCDHQQRKFLEAHEVKILQESYSFCKNCDTYRGVTEVTKTE